MVKRKKGGLGEDPLSWIQKSEVSEVVESPENGDLENSKVHNLGTPELKEIAPSELKKLRNQELPKFKTFDVKLSILIREDQLDYLEKTVRSLMKKRKGLPGKKERITKNTLVRAMIDVLRGVPFDPVGVCDEGALKERIEAAIQAKGS